MTDPAAPELPLTPGAQRLMDEVGGRPDAGAHDWLFALLERFGPMVESLSPGLEPGALRQSLGAASRQGEHGAPLAPAALLLRARSHAQGLGKPRVSERDLAVVVLSAAGYVVVETAGTPASPGSARASAGAASAGPGTLGEAAAAPIRVMRPTPTLERFGRDLTRAARDGKLGTVIGRDTEIETIVETLCRTTKRNPLLVGPAGTGKTAIIEGLAQRIVKDQVPALLRGARLFGLQPSALVAGAGIVGELDKRVGAILAEVDQPGVLLFIDEVHAIMGAGGREGTGDLASMLKPALARGDIACIAATTDEEYRRFIENDRALERRFQVIRIDELSPQRTLQVLKGVRDDLVRGRGVEVGDEVLAWLVEVARQFMPNRRFPDKAVDLLDQTVAHAVSRQLPRVEREHAEAVVQRMLGIPSLGPARFEALRARLAERSLLAGADGDRLVNRLEVTSQGLDLRAARPNAVLVLTGRMAESAEPLATTIAETLYGDPERVVRVDFGRFRDESSLNALLGSPAGYVGYDDRHALHALTETPWCVLLCQRIDWCHPAVLAAFTPGILSGVLTDLRGRRIYFSDAVVILTAGAVTGGTRTIGFGAGDRPEEERPAAAEALGLELADAADFVFADPPAEVATGAEWITARLLPEVAAKHRERGVELEWDPTLVNWLAAEWAAGKNPRGIERLVENEIGPVLVRAMEHGAGAGPGRYLVKRQSASVVVERLG